MKILVTNDDGVSSLGLWKAAEALLPLGEVWVVAPDREQSGVGSAMTLHIPVRAREVLPAAQGVKAAYAVEGTPADSVVLATEKLVGPVDLVVSGINTGSNVGGDILVSGTVGAALQGYFRGFNSLAVSLAAMRDLHYETATKLISLLVPQLFRDSLPTPMLLNINVPNVPPHEVQGLEVTRLGRRSYTEVVNEGQDGVRAYYWISRSKPVPGHEEGTDVWALNQKRISITPLGTQLTAHDHLPHLESLRGELLRLLQEQPQP